MLNRALLGCLLLLFTEAVMAIEEPKYSVLEQSGAFELRTYRPMIVAQTHVNGSMNQASRAGFKVIADYIFGNNALPQGDSEKVSMTAPVTVEAMPIDKLDVATPASMERIGEHWRMHFVMPEKYTMESLPVPNNPSVILREIPERNYAVIRFSGLTTESKVAKKTASLLTWVRDRGITPTGKPEIARYNPPWTLPFLRRNEIMLAY